MATIVNLTPHRLTVRVEESTVTDYLDSDINLEPSGKIARINQTSVTDTPINGIPTTRTVFGDIVDLPEPAHDTVFVVSLPVAQIAAQQGRRDVVSPDTSPKGGAVRYTEGSLKGQIFAVRGFQRF